MVDEWNDMLDDEWDDMADNKKIALLRRFAESLRTGKRRH